MDIYNTTSIWYIRILLILILLNGITNSATLSDLNRVCVYYFPHDTNKTTVVPPKNLCTALATYGDKGFHRPYKHFDTISFKGSLPYVFIYDELLTWNLLKKRVKHRHVHHYVKHLNELIVKKNIDVLVFDVGISEFDEDAYSHRYSETFQENLKSFLNTMKGTHQNMLFGLKINRRADLSKRVFNPDIIGNSTDLYVVRSLDYKHCDYEDDQSNMAQPPSPAQLQTTITDLSNAGYDVKKMFLTIHVDVRSYKNGHKLYPENWSYSRLCAASHPGKRRRYCKGTLDNFYQQATVIYKNQLPGVFIEAIDCDDYGCSCQCGCFPAAQAIFEGISGSPPDEMINGCQNFARLPRDHNPEPNYL